MEHLTEVLVVSDIHGELDKFEKALKHWDKDKQYLALLGDYVDRGPDSLGVLKKVKELREQYGEQIITLKGNHDVMFIEYLNYAQGKTYLYRNGGQETIESFTKGTTLTDSHEIINYIKSEHIELLSMMEEFSYYKVIGKLLLTHAGYDSSLDSWQDTSNYDFMWIRNHWMAKNKTGYVNVFGHTPTIAIRAMLNMDSTDSSPMSFDEGKFWAIDGGSCYNGKMNAATFNLEGKMLSYIQI